ncbi:MAG: hypothetical protein JWM98_837, partial [Thermoleophilia bacterium]|nr:hypothetical protein [Thermoleophilia bacterium]
TSPGASLSGATDTVSGGFSREGGRLEFVDHTTVNRGPLPPFTAHLPLDESVTAAATGVFHALQGADWIDGVTVSAGTAAHPATVTWTYRNDDRVETASLDLVPAKVQAVLDATAVLDHVAHLELEAPFVQA